MSIRQTTAAVDDASRIVGSGETLTTTPFDARQATTVIHEMEGYEEGLRRRTEGITWMIWALVFAGISMSYWVMGLVSPPGAEDAAAVLPDRGLVTPWIGWVVAGGLATAAIWRGAALKESSGLRHVAALAAIMAGTWILFIASWLLPAAISQYVYAGGPLALFGLSTLIVLSTRLMPLSAQGRNAGRLVASAQIAIALTVGLLQGWSVLPALPTALGGAVVVGVTWLAAGLWQTSQG